MNRFALIFGAVLLLAACVGGYSDHARAAPIPTTADVARACANMGYAPGTAAFQSCYLNLLSTLRSSYAVGNG